VDSPVNGDTRLEMSQVVMPADANHYGKLHGGRVMYLADNLAYALASKFSRRDVVTARVSELNFRGPVKVGDMVRLEATLTRVGRSSMDIRVCVRADSLKTGESWPVADALFTMVAVGDDGRPVAVGRELPEAGDCGCGQ